MRKKKDERPKSEIILEKAVQWFVIGIGILVGCIFVYEILNSIVLKY